MIRTEAQRAYENAITEGILAQATMQEALETGENEANAVLAVLRRLSFLDHQGAGTIQNLYSAYGIPETAVPSAIYWIKEAEERSAKIYAKCKNKNDPRFRIPDETMRTLSRKVIGQYCTANKRLSAQRQAIKKTGEELAIFLHQFPGTEDEDVGWQIFSWMRSDDEGLGYRGNAVPCKRR